MKIGVRAHDFGKMEACELASAIKRCGFDAVQLAPPKAIAGIADFTDITNERMLQVRKAFEENDVEISVYGCYIEPALPDKDKRLEQVDIFQKALAYARVLGANVVGTETTGFTPNCGYGREHAFALLKDSVLRMVETAEKENVTIGIEPVAIHTLHTAEMARQLLDEIQSPKLKIIYDPVNILTLENIDEQDAIATQFLTLLGKDIVAVHLKDFVFVNGENEWRNIGKGIVNHAPIISWLARHNPNISILREGVMLDSVPVDIKRMRELLATNS